jgi:hypothetical protein
MKILEQLESLLIKLTNEEGKVETEQKLSEDFKTIEGVSVSFDPALQVDAMATIEGQDMLNGSIELEDGRIIDLKDGVVIDIKEKAPEPVAEQALQVDYAPQIEALQNQINDLKATLKLSVEAGINLSKELEQVKAMPTSAPIVQGETKHTNLHLFTKKK